MRWGALLIGFFGVLIVTNPGADFAPARRAVRARQRGDVWQRHRRGARHDATESANTLLMWQMATMAVFHSFLLVFGFRMPTLADGAMLFLSGVANAAAQYFWTQALRLAPTTAVSPFYYLMLVWAMVIGFLVWGDVPTIGLLIGSAIVVASGLFLLWHEARQRRGAAVSRPRLAASRSAERRQRLLACRLLVRPFGDDIGHLSIGIGRPKR